MKSTPSVHHSAVAIAIAGAFGGAAHADNFDVNNILNAKLAPKLGQVYRATLGKPMPSGTTATLSFKGTIVSQGINYTLPSSIPQNPLILQQNTLSNCNDLESSQHVTVNKTTTQTESWSSTDTVSADISVTASYDSPIGVGVSGTAAAGYSKDWNKGGENDEALTWEAGADVPVGPGKQVMVQFVVDEQNIDVPYKMDFVATGTTYVTFTTPGSGTTSKFVWTGSKPGNAIAGGKEENGTTLYVCRASYRGGLHAGKVVNGLCNIGYGGKEEALTDYEWLGGSDLIWVSGLGSDAVSAGQENGQDRWVCRVTAHGGIHPGKYVDGKCNYGYGGKEESSSTYETLNRKPATAAQTNTVMVTLENYLTSAADRTITLHGVYTGVTAVQGDFRVDAPKLLECGAASQAAATSVQAPSASAKMAATPQAAARAQLPIKVASAPELKNAVALPKTAHIGGVVKPKPAPGK